MRVWYVCVGVVGACVYGVCMRARVRGVCACVCACIHMLTGVRESAF